jgi:hypothetical protein
LVTLAAGACCTANRAGLSRRADGMEDREVYESSSQPLISRRAFFRRLGLHLLLALGITIASLVVGMLGYMSLAGLSPVDAFLNASMILGGMGPVDVLQSNGAKIFAGLYALFSGFILLGVAGVILAPIFHRLLHAFHIDTDASDEADDKEESSAEGAQA